MIFAPVKETEEKDACKDFYGAGNRTGSAQI